MFWRAKRRVLITAKIFRAVRSVFAKPCKQLIIKKPPRLAVFNKLFFLFFTPPRLRPPHPLVVRVTA